MRAVSRVPWFAVLALSGVAGCQPGQPLFAPSSTYQQSQLQRIQQQQLAASQQQQQNLQAAASTIDRANEEKERQLAASRQDVQRLEAHVSALSSRLKETAAEVVRERSEKQALEKKYDDFLAANRRTGSVSITANSSHGVDLAAVEIRGVDIRRDGEVIRVTLPASQLFTPGSAQLTAGGGSLLSTVGAELGRAYPRQLIGVEGHAEAAGQDPIQFSALRAQSVCNYLIARGGLRREQLHVAGHGANHPVYSNATPAGREANQRVELVVYPDTLSNAPR